MKKRSILFNAMRYGVLVLVILNCFKKEDDQAVAQQGDFAEGGYLMAKGKNLFDLHCKKCHSTGSEGGNIGPSLKDLGSRMDGTMIREGIIEPSRKIKDGYSDHVMPDNFATLMNEEELDALIFYLTNM